MPGAAEAERTLGARRCLVSLGESGLGAQAGWVEGWPQKAGCQHTPGPLQDAAGPDFLLISASCWVRGGRSRAERVGWLCGWALLAWGGACAEPRAAGCMEGLKGRWGQEGLPV